MTTFFRPGILDEGALAPGTPLARQLRPDPRRWCASTTARSSTATRPCSSRAPSPAMAFPGNSILSILDGLPGIGVDWAMRVRRRDPEAAMALNEKMLERSWPSRWGARPGVGFHPGDHPQDPPPWPPTTFVDREAGTPRRSSSPPCRPSAPRPPARAGPHHRNPQSQVPPPRHPG